MGSMAHLFFGIDPMGTDKAKNLNPARNGNFGFGMIWIRYQNRNPKPLRILDYSG